MYKLCQSTGSLLFLILSLTIIIVEAKNLMSGEDVDVKKTFVLIARGFYLFSKIEI